MHTPSSSPARLPRNAKNSSSVTAGGSPAAAAAFLPPAAGAPAPSTKSALWQNGQRKLHPGVNTVAAVRPGKSSSVSFCKPAMRMG